ncbi:MAG TPA: aldehyde dehydrogenase family protein [Streptosporangiaceae bacterium]
MISTSGQSPASPHRYQQFIAGEWADAEGGGTFEDFSPYDGSVFAQVPASTAADARRAVESAAAAFPSWKATPPGARQRLLLRATGPPCTPSPSCPSAGSRRAAGAGSAAGRWRTSPTAT